jgi:hypothetical protein
MAQDVAEVVGSLRRLISPSLLFCRCCRLLLLFTCCCCCCILRSPSEARRQMKGFGAGIYGRVIRQRGREAERQGRRDGDAKKGHKSEQTQRQKTTSRTRKRGTQSAHLDYSPFQGLALFTAEREHARNQHLVMLPAGSGQYSSIHSFY